MPQILEITDLSAPELAVYTHLTESGAAADLFVAESPLVIGRALEAGYAPVSLLAERRRAESLPAGLEGIPVYTADREVLARLTGFHLTRGMLCALRRPPLRDIRILCAHARRVAVLENLTDPTNTGAVFRSAAALGIDAVLIGAAGADPLSRRASRASMGTVFRMPWTREPDWPARLRELGFRTAALALREDALPLADPRLASAERLALVLGNEGSGLTAETIAACDWAVQIPMVPGVDSLNVAAAAAVAFYQLGAIERPCVQSSMGAKGMTR